MIPLRHTLLALTLAWATVLAGVGLSPARANPGLEFIENRGQWPDQALFHTPLGDGAIWYGPDHVVFDFWKPGLTAHHHDTHPHDYHERAVGHTDIQGHAFQVTFLGGTAQAVQGEDLTYDQRNYFFGNDPSRWASRVRSYSTLRYRQMYPGVDVVYRMRPEGGMKYDLELAAGADPGQVQLHYSGLNSLQVTAEGHLQMGYTFGSLQELAPQAYQLVKGDTVWVECQFQLTDQVVTFSFPEGYILNQPLVIDPFLVFSTYSGSLADNWGSTACTDAEGNGLSAGLVFSAGYPTTLGAYRQSPIGGIDIGIYKVDETGRDQVFATYVGGGATESPTSMLVNSVGDIVLLGTTGSPDWPITGGAVQPVFEGGPSYTAYAPGNPSNTPGLVTFFGGTDLFIIKLSGDGSQLLGSTFFGGGANEGANGYGQALTRNYGDQFRGELALDDSDNIYLASNTRSANVAVAPTLAYAGGQEGLVAKFNTNLTSLVWWSYLGGSGQDAAYSLRPLPNGNLVVVGGTTSADFPTTPGTLHPDAALLTQPGLPVTNGFATVFTADGTALASSTYLGTTNYDQAFFVDTNVAGEVFVMGQTRGNYDVTSGVYSVANGALFIHALNPALDATLFSTAVGDAARNALVPTAFLVNECNLIFISGWGNNSPTPLDGAGLGNYVAVDIVNYPTTPDAAKLTSDGSDFYLMVLNENAEGLAYGSFFGGDTSNEHVDGGTNRFDKSGVVYSAACAGCGGSSDFPASPNAWSTLNNSTNCSNAIFKFDLSVLRADYTLARRDGGDPDRIFRDCAPIQVRFDNTSTNGQQFIWKVDDVVVSTKPNTSIDFEEPGSYEVKLVVEDISTCSQADSISQVFEVLDPQFDGVDDALLCYRDLYDMTPTYVEPAESFAIFQDRGDKVEAVPNFNGIVTALETGEYITETVDARGCLHYDTVQLEVVPFFDADFEVTGNYDCQGLLNFTLTNTSEGVASSLWTTSDGQSLQSDETTLDFTLPPGQPVTITLRREQQICTEEHSAQVTPQQLFLPNVVTLNNDQRNEAFVLGVEQGSTDLFTDLVQEPVAIEIVNRWGQRVYESDNYQNDWQGQGLESGVYYYRLGLPNGQSCNGWIQLMK